MEKILALVDYFRPFKYFILTSVIFTDFNFSWFNLKIGCLLNEFLFCVWVDVYFNSFCQWTSASKLSNTNWRRLSGDWNSSSLSSLSTAADILYLLTHWYVDVISYSCKSSSSFLSWAKIPMANYSWVKKFVSPDVTIVPINVGVKLLSKLEEHKKVIRVVQIHQ